MLFYDLVRLKHRRGTRHLVGPRRPDPFGHLRESAGEMRARGAVAVQWR